MNTTLKATVLAILTLGGNQLYADLQIKAKLIEASPDIPVTTDLAPLSQLKGVDLLSAPQVTVKSGTKAKIDITREFSIQGQKSVPVGIELEITADQTPTGLSYIAKYKLTEFEGFINYGVDNPEHKRQPVFQTTTIPFDGPAQDNVPMLIDISNKRDSSKKRYIHLTIKKV